MSDLARRLDEALRGAGVPITGVFIGDDTNRSTWRVQSPALQAQAQPIIDAYVLPTPAQMLDEDAERETTEKKLQAISLALWECIPAPTMTKAQFKARAKAIFKTL